jgi:hypothetical protein
VAGARGGVTEDEWARETGPGCGIGGWSAQFLIAEDVEGDFRPVDLVWAGRGLGGGAWGNHPFDAKKESHPPYRDGWQEQWPAAGETRQFTGFE